MQYKHVRDCEDRILDRFPKSTDCEAMISQFENRCSKEDIQYAYESFAKDAKLMCSFKTRAEVESFKSSLDQTKISSACRP